MAVRPKGALGVPLGNEARSAENIVTGVPSSEPEPVILVLTPVMAVWSEAVRSPTAVSVEAAAVAAGSKFPKMVAPELWRLSESP
jgi:hypothetical protein